MIFEKIISLFLDTCTIIGVGSVLIFLYLIIALVIIKLEPIFKQIAKAHKHNWQVDKRRIIRLANRIRGIKK